MPSTIWSNQNKRNVGNSSVLVDDPVAIVDSTTVLVGGSNPVTDWVFQQKATN